MPGFGLIHELASVEQQTRRALASAMHQAHTARSLLADNNGASPEQAVQLMAMLDSAMRSIKSVIGD